jgi:acetylornithine deacetylase/succinyl-diaminopimelate desuccinylase-like protein
MMIANGASRRGFFFCCLLAALTILSGSCQASDHQDARPRAQVVQPDWPALEEETLEHFQAILRLDTSNPPGGETRVVEYLEGVLEREGIASRRYALEPERANLVARLRGSGAKRPLLLMAHTDVVTVRPEAWRHPPFSATREGGFVYGRGTLDDKDNVVASLMMLILLKRLDVPLDRDVIFLAEAGEEGTTRVGIDFMVENHFDAIDAEFCLAEGGGVVRRGGKVQFASIGTLEKTPRAVELIATGPAGHGSVALQGNAIVRLASAVTAVTAWDAPVRLNETTREYFRRLAEISPAAEARRYRSLLSPDPAEVYRTAEYFRRHSPAIDSQLRTSVSPTILRGGDRYNVIPSEARATVDVRVLPGDDVEDVLEQLAHVVNDPAVTIRLAPRDGVPRPAGGTSLGTDAFRAVESAVTRHYDTVTLPTMSTGATDSAQLRAMGIQCYGVGPAVDAEDGPAGFGAHSDQERILESELHRFVRFYWDAVVEIAGA